MQRDRFYFLALICAMLVSSGFAQERRPHNRNSKDDGATVTPQALPPLVNGSGTIGRIPKWTAFSGSTYTLGDSVVTEKNGLIGVGLDTPTSQLAVAGIVQSTAGGFKFPDGTIQTTAGISPGQVVSSLNGLTGPVSLAAGSNITITPSGNSLTIGTSVTNPALTAFQKALSLKINPSSTTVVGEIPVPAGKRLVIEYVTIRVYLPPGALVTESDLNTTINGNLVSHEILPTKVLETISGDRWVCERLVRIYADGGTSANLVVFFSQNGLTGTVLASVSGHLVDLP